MHDNKCQARAHFTFSLPFQPQSPLLKTIPFTLFLFLFLSLSLLLFIMSTIMDTAVRKATRLDYQPPKVKHLTSKLSL